MDGLQRMAEWSDKFFNFDDAFGCGRDEEMLHKAAQSFLRLHPECPYDEAWLIRDYLKRL